MNATWRQTLVSLTIFSVASAGPAREGSSAEVTSFRVSYGGTAGYQLPLWVNKEAGIYKKYGIDLEVILIGAAQKDPAGFFDMSLIEEIEREGFIQKLYGP